MLFLKPKSANPVS